MTCPNNAEKLAERGHERPFPAQVKDGVLRGETGVAESEGWLRIEGRSAPTAAPGSMRTVAPATRTTPPHTRRHPRRTRSTSTRASTTRRGSGRRLEQRVCNFVFKRR